MESGARWPKGGRRIASAVEGSGRKRHAAGCCLARATTSQAIGHGAGSGRHGGLIRLRREGEADSSRVFCSQPHAEKPGVWPTARPASSLVSWQAKPMTTKKRLTLGLSLVAACCLAAAFSTPAFYIVRGWW